MNFWTDFWPLYKDKFRIGQAVCVWYQKAYGTACPDEDTLWECTDKKVVKLYIEQLDEKVQSDGG